MKTDSQIIDDLGGTSALAKALGISAASVSEWRKLGIPNARKQTLALLYPNETPKAWLPKAA
jgi:hypothetical protein